MSDSYSEKSVVATVLMSEGKSSFEKRFEGFAIEASIDKPGPPDTPTATVTILGLGLDTMASLTQLAFDHRAKRKNLLKIEAGERGRTLSTVFTGEITSAWADFNAAPDVEFQIDAKSASYPNLIPQPPISVRGQQTAADAIKSLCDEIGYTFENHGVSASISNCILHGSPVHKMRWIAETVGASLIIDDTTCALVPKYGVRAPAGGIPLISVETGMIGWPTFDDKGIRVESFFRPDVRIGSTVRVASIVPRASGVWKVTSLHHDLSANNPDGADKWITSIYGVYVDD